MPIYYVAWSVPLIGLLVTKSEYIPNEAGIIRGAFAAQSFSQFHFLDQPNPPLWSLSIEIYLTFFFIYSVNFKRWCLTLICVAIFFMNSQDNFLSQTPFFSGLPMFLLGIILAKQKLILSKRTNTLLGIILFFVYLTCAPYFVHGTELVTGSRNLFVVAVMVWLINLGRLQKARNFASYLGQRSYSLYAIHWPLMFFLDHIFSSLSTAPELLKLISFLILIAVAVEVTYRTVEVPAVVISRRILQTK